MYNKLMIIKNGKENELETYFNNKYTIIVAWAEFCGPCTMVKAQLELLASQREDVNVVELNVDDNQSFVMKNRLTGTPTVIIYKDGQEINKFVGFQPREIIEEKLK